MNIIVERLPGDKPGPSIVDSLLVTEALATERGVAEINYHESNRSILSGNGPRNFFMEPGSLVQITDGEGVTRGIVKMYSRSYNLESGRFSVTSSMIIETEDE
jgi:hypothetical protein